MPYPKCMDPNDPNAKLATFILAKLKENPFLDFWQSTANVNSNSNEVDIEGPVNLVELAMAIREFLGLNNEIVIVGPNAS